MGYDRLDTRAGVSPKARNSDVRRINVLTDSAEVTISNWSNCGIESSNPSALGM